MIIKSVARRPWGDRERAYDCWYEPFGTPEIIQQSVNFSLSLAGVTGLCTTGDMTILPLFLQACQNFKQMTPEMQEELIASASQHEAVTIFE